MEFIVSWDEYTRSVHMLLAGLGKGIDVDFTKRKLVGVGHSMGAVALYVSSFYFFGLENADLFFWFCFSLASGLWSTPMCQQ